MTGHLLKTVNPEAADAMDSGPTLRPIGPRPGMVVEYTMRNGHGRMGRTRFPAFVMGESQHGPGVDLLVFIDAGDMIDEQMVPQKGPGAEHHCWDWLEEGSAALAGIRATIASLHQRVGEVEGGLRKLEAVVLGDFAPPNVSIIHIMQDFENRLRAKAAPADAEPAAPARRARAAPKPRAAKKAKKAKRGKRG